jgi:hypothetical protein
MPVDRRQLGGDGFLPLARGMQAVDGRVHRGVFRRRDRHEIANFILRVALRIERRGQESPQVLDVVVDENGIRKVGCDYVHVKSSVTCPGRQIASSM